MKINDIILNYIESRSKLIECNGLKLKVYRVKSLRDISDELNMWYHDFRKAINRMRGEGDLFYYWDKHSNCYIILIPA